ncbi:MAG: caspase family protein [Deltaproteobacteria bacterium]|nr:caspase family protein [Deltaproteobacteria bacterium]
MSVQLTSLILTALAATPRVGFFVGSNGAPAGRTALEHAETDARNMRRVFVELGGLAAEDAHLLESPTAAAIVDAIQRAGSGAQVLVFYYSGHADTRALLLEGSELSFTELDRVLAAAGAELRLELIDACRSGAMTRNKGAQLGERLHLETSQRGEGRVVITSSSEWEDSFESDQIGGSFFTLHMATGLRGAADGDADGMITLAEAYRYVYGRTVESTLHAGAGAQHPTFAYELSGRGELVLTWPGRSGGALWFGQGEYWVIDRASGRLAAEIETSGGRLSLPSGRYRVHRRGQTEVWSGEIQLDGGAVVRVDPLLTEREAFARLVRKGRDRDPVFSQALRLSGGVRSRVADGVDAAALLRVGYELVLPWFSVMPYLQGSLPRDFSTDRLRFSTLELGFGLLISQAIDLDWLSLRGGLAWEGLRLSQSEESGLERSRSGWGTAFAAHLGVESPPLIGDLFASAAVEAALYVYRDTAAALEPTGEGEISTRPALRGVFTLGYEF